MAVNVETIEKEVAFFLGYGYTIEASGQHGSFLNNIAYRAMQQFVIPPIIQGESSAHKWSWLSDTQVLVLNEPVTFSQSSAAGFLLHTNVSADVCPHVTSGVIRLGCDSTTVASNFPSWSNTGSADQVGAMVEVSGIGAGADGWHIPTEVTNVSNTDFTVTIPDTSVTIAEADVTNVSSGVQSGVSFTIYNVMLAADINFGSVDGNMIHDINSGYPNVQVINIGALRDLYAAKPITTGPPEYVAWDETVDRFLFYPAPDKSYTLRFKYTKDVNMAASGTDDVIDLNELIPAKFEGTVINSALALAELYTPESPSRGRFQEVFASQLKAAVYEDRANHRVEHFGTNTDRSDMAESYGRKTDRSDIYYTNSAGTRFPS